MHTKWSRFKYRFAASILVPIFHAALKDRNSEYVKPIEPAPFFLIGSGRNGSTLLSAILNNNPEIFIPPEQFVLPYAILKWDLKRYVSTDKIISEIVNDFSIEGNTSNWNMDFQKLKLFFESENTSLLPFNKLIEKIYLMYGCENKNNKFIWGDKSPMNTHYVPLIDKHFPSSKYIFLVRDPRDVILSCSKVKSHPVSDINVASWKWNDSVKMYNWLKKNKNKDELLLVKYEDIVTDVKRETIRITNFLNVDWKQNMLDHRAQVGNLGVSDISYHSNLKNIVNTDSIGKWKREFSNEQIKSIERLVLKNMKQFGYS